MTATNTATGPKTAQGKAISARNATTHGLFCRQTVLPHLGEDPNAYNALLDALHEQLRPRNLMERQYLELWADASWKMRRLSRFEAQTWEDDRLDPDELLTKLERLARLQAGLRRQLDRAVYILCRAVPALYARRTREDVMEKLSLTETLCAENPYRQKDVERAVQINSHWLCPDDLGPRLDNTTDADTTDAAAPAPTPDAPAEPLQEPSPEPCENKNCQNEPTPAASPDHPATAKTTGKPIGSGRMEKAVDQVVAMRPKKKGMSWSRLGSQSLALLRIAALNGQWSQLWTSECATP